MAGRTRSNSDTKEGGGSQSAVIHTWMVSNNVMTVHVPVQGLTFEVATQLQYFAAELNVLSSYVHAVSTLDAGLLARSQYSEGPVTGHLNIGFSLFPSVYKQMLRWFPRFQVATTCLSCSPPDLNLLVTNFIFCIHVK